MSDSALEAIATSAVAAGLTVAEILAGEEVTVTQIFERMPSAYPGFVLSLNDDEVQVLQATQLYGGAAVMYRVPVYIALYATSDGTTEAAARRKVWKIGEAFQRKLMILTPTGGPDGITFWPFEPDLFEPLLIDAHTHGLLMRFWAKYTITGAI